MSSTLMIVCKDARSQADVKKFIGIASSPREAMRKLEHYFERAACGAELCYVSCGTSANAPVQAQGKATLTYASIANSDTVTIAGQVLTCVTGTPTTHQFKKQTDAPTTAANLAALINSDAVTSLYVSATSSSNVVTITANMPGSVGNFIPMATSNGTGFALDASTLGTTTAGAGGMETTVTSFSRGL